MRNKVLLVLAAISMIMFVMPFASDSVADAPASNYYIQGYVANIKAEPMEGVTVSVADGLGNISSGDTDSAGLFTVGISANYGLSISFTAFGHLTVTCPNTSPLQGSEYRALSLSKAQYNSGTRTYIITGTVADMQCAIMIAEGGTVKGHVTFGSNPVKNATVTLTPFGNDPLPKGIDYTGRTDSHGYYEIRDCPVGNYTLTVSNQGFHQSDAYNVTVSETPTTVNVKMVKSTMRTHLGMDTAHLLMLIGVVVGIILAVAAWFLSKRMNMPRGPHGVEVIDDSGEEEEDSRYP